MKEVIEEMRKRIEILSRELRTLVHKPSCLSPYTCPLECGPECRKQLDIYTSLVWECADILMGVDRALTHLFGHPLHITEIREYVNRCIHTIDSFRYVVGRHADKYHDAYNFITAGYFLLYDIDAVLRKEEEDVE